MIIQPGQPRTALRRRADDWSSILSIALFSGLENDDSVRSQNS